MLFELYSYPCALYHVTLRTKLWGHYRHFHPINGHLGSTLLQSSLHDVHHEIFKEIGVKIGKEEK